MLAELGKLWAIAKTQGNEEAARMIARTMVFFLEV